LAKSCRKNVDLTEVPLAFFGSLGVVRWTQAQSGSRSWLDRGCNAHILRVLLSARRQTTSKEDVMPTFMLSLNWTEQGVRNIKDSPKRVKAARDLAKKVDVELKQLYLTTGDSDLVAFVETPNGDNVAKFALALSALGNVRTRTARAWPEAEYLKLISELP
jgi:uncharacterized protein with GYD domain